jgi:hypothetical protein
VAWNGSASRAPLLHVEYAFAPSANQPPTVDAGPDQTITLPAGATLEGTVADDGRVNPTATTTWTMVSGPAAVDFTDATALDSQVSFPVDGTYVLRLSADDGALTSSDDVTVVVNPAPSPSTHDVRVAASSDDAEQASTGTVSRSSTDLDLGSSQTVGLRFVGLRMPAGPTITKAYIQFTADEGQSVATSLTIRGQDADNASTFSTASSNISLRPRTDAFVSWRPAAWSLGQAGENQRTPDLRTVVQEVVNRTGWAGGNAIAFVITGSGHRAAQSYNGAASKAPLLHVEWQ